MNFTTDKIDPLHILETTKYVLDNAKDVSISAEAVGLIAEKVKNKIMTGLPGGEETFGKLESLEQKAQFAFVVDSVNFCFWAEKGKTKWQIEYPTGNFVGGGFGLMASFQRALASKVPILNSGYLSNITIGQTRELFKSSNEAEIPLLDRRKNNLQEIGKVLNEKYEGKFLNLIEAANFDAVGAIKLIVRDFTSYNDIARYNDIDVYFYKRAQLCVCDISLFKDIKMKNIEKLTAFADYKLPQILREFGVIEYSNTLAERIDNFDLIPAGSHEETEIRAATIWGVELIRQNLKKYTAAEIDNAIWYLSQDQNGVKPFHRTYTIYY